MMNRTMIDTPEDVQWLRETHLKNYHGPAVNFASAVLEGNEDCPQAIELYVCALPFVTDGCMRLVYESVSDTYVRT